MLAVLFAALWCTIVTAEDAVPPTRADAPKLDLPVTIEKLWYRAGGKRHQGDLTISAEGLEFVTRRRAFSMPLERIRFISFGKLAGDVDTDWVLLSVGVARPYELAGLRDGKKWGYGGRTREIFEQLRRAFEQLAAAQYRVAPGFQVYEVPDRACALAIPENWSSYLESVVLVEGRTPWGTTVLSEKPIRSSERAADGTFRSVDDLELLEAILAGESQGFFIERGRVGRGMSCNAFSTSARERVLDRARADVVFGQGLEVTAPPALSADTVGGCAALRVLGRSRRPDGAELVLELYAVAQGETLYLFGLRALADRYEAHRQPFAAAVASVQFGVDPGR